MAERRWWREGVLYQIYPRSFADSNGDGIGDLCGVIDRLDHLEWLGIDGIWLSPIHPSPNEDWGYDVSDYLGVHPELGTLDDVDELVAEAGRRGIRVLLDLVPNHTSDRHPWFRERPELYVWADAPPNNWRSVFDRRPSWTLDGERGRYYLHTFAGGQPDLDWRNPEVPAEFERILRFWLDRGVAGFRLDVVNVLYKDSELRDEPPARPEDPPLLRELGMRRIHSMNQPEIHDLLQDWRRLCEEYEPPRILVGEVYAFQVPHWASYYGNGDDQLHLSFNFQLMYNPLVAAKLSAVVAEVEHELPAGAWPCWAGSNHDGGRLASRWARGDERLSRCGLMILLGLRGTPFLYYGDELGLLDGEVPPDRRLDRAEPGRDAGRTPMPWSRAGDWRDPWLPLVDTSRNVADQRVDADSTLHFTRELIALRRRLPDLRVGSYRELESPEDVWAWRRGEGCVVAVNLGVEEARLEVEGRIELSTDPERGGESFAGHLAAGEGVILAGDPSK
ncbi:MAG: alpha-amylase family glycosyl hydrolase [Gaiellaceae bacterium MAG52_C11]|nr:alpha-amylase family glycosyl hydrolase [Candidatus Gaiellasilicea maunaloa]